MSYIYFTYYIILYATYIDKLLCYKPIIIMKPKRISHYRRARNWLLFKNVLFNF